MGVSGSQYTSGLDGLPTPKRISCLYHYTMPKPPKVSKIMVQKPIKAIILHTFGVQVRLNRCVEVLPAAIGLFM